MSSKNSFIKIELKQEYDVINQTYMEDRSIKLDKEALQKGIIKDVGATEFVVLMAIASFTDIEGEAFPSQRKLVEVTGLSLPTINKVVNKLLEIEINGVPVLSREFESSEESKKKFSVYKINTASKYTESEEAQKDEKLKVNFQKGGKVKTSRDFALMFKGLYEEEYKIPYSINFVRDTAMIKTKLLKDFNEQQITEMIEYVIKNYRTKWANSKYPYPTISMVASWLGNTAIQLLEQEKAKQVEVERLESMTAEYLETDYADFDNI